MGFNLGPEKILVVLAFALVLLGPDKLPDAARKIGEWAAQARRLSNGLQADLRQVLDEPLQALQSGQSAGDRGVAPRDPTVEAASQRSSGPNPTPPAGLSNTTDVSPDAPATAGTSDLPTWVFPECQAGSERSRSQ